jgi:SAM-dependent methyltransferase
MCTLPRVITSRTDAPHRKWSIVLSSVKTEHRHPALRPSRILAPLARRTLVVPALYRATQHLTAGAASRQIFVDEHVRARGGERVLDVGCGPADIVPYLPRVDYTGFDANAECIATASRNYGDRAQFYCGRVADESIPEKGSFDIVLAIGIVHHLDDGEAEHLFRLAHSALKPGGRLVTIDPIFAKGQSWIARFLISHDRGEHVRDHRGYVAIASRAFSTIRPVVRTDLLRVPYTHLILECER